MYFNVVIILSSLFVPVKGAFLIGYEDVQLDLPVLQSFQTPFSQICLHECALNQICHVASVSQVTDHHYQCLFFDLVQISNIKQHFKPSKGHVVYRFMKENEKIKVPSKQSSFTIPSECSQPFFIQNSENSKFISYDEGRNVFVYQSLEKDAEKFCSTENALYTLAREGCMENGSKTVILGKACNTASTKISLVADGREYRIKNIDRCLRAAELSNTANGDVIYFDVECNDSRLKYRLIYW